MAEPGRPLLLVVDDDRTIRRLLARVAERAGFDVDTARDGAEALEKIAANDYAIAIVDLMMPRVSGYELVQKIGTMNPHPAVIVATAMTNGDLANIDDTMVRRIIRKPFDIEAVAAALVETARDVTARRAGEQAALPPDATAVATDATIRVENVTVVADKVTIVADDVTILPPSEERAAVDAISSSEAPIAPDEPIPPEDQLQVKPK